MLLRHFSKHIVSGAIYDTHYRSNLISSQRGFHSLQNRNTTSNACLEHKVTISSFCQGEQLCTVLSQNIFICSYNALAVFKCLCNEFFSRVFPTNQFYYDVNFRVFQNLISIGCVVVTIAVDSCQLSCFATENFCNFNGHTNFFCDVSSVSF